LSAWQPFVGVVLRSRAESATPDRERMIGKPNFMLMVGLFESINSGFHLMNGERYCLKAPRQGEERGGDIYLFPENT
jgi:hypothetical protein